VQVVQLAEIIGRELEEVVIGDDKVVGHHLLLDVVEFADAPVVNQGAAKIEICAVVLVEDCGGYVWYVAAGVALTCHVDFEVADAEAFLEVG
jgi:hypothetical protein